MSAADDDFQQELPKKGKHIVIPRAEYEALRAAAHCLCHAAIIIKQQAKLIDEAIAALRAVGLQIDPSTILREDLRAQYLTGSKQ